MGLLDGLFSSSNTTTNNNPIADLQRSYLPGIYQSATDLYNQGTPGYYPGSTVAAFDPVRAQGLNLGVDTALGAQTSLAAGQTNLIGGILGGSDAYTNQLAQQASTAAGAPFAGAGTFGGARHAAAANKAASDAILGRQLEAAGQVTNAQQAAIQPSRTLSSIGQATQAHEQAILDADKQRYDATVDKPWEHLARYQNVITSPNAAAYNEGTTQSESPSLFNTITGGISTLKGLGVYNQGGEVPTQQIAQGVYSPVDTIRTEYGDSGWRRPQSSHGWALIDGRYQYVPTKSGMLPGGGQAQTSYVPTAVNTGLGTEVVNTGGNGGSGVGTGAVRTDDAGNPAPYKGVDQYDWDGNDNFLTQDELKAYNDTIANTLNVDEFDPTKTVAEQAGADATAAWQQTDATADNYLPTSNAGVSAADAIYNNNQVIYGDDTGNNVTSLTAGGLTNAGLAQDAANVKAGQDGGLLEKIINSTIIGQIFDKVTDHTAPEFEDSVDKQTENLADDFSNANPNWDWNDPSTWGNSNQTSTNNNNDDDNSPTHAEIMEAHYGTGWSDTQTASQKEASDVGFGSDTGGWSPPGFSFFNQGGPVMSPALMAIKQRYGVM